MDFMIHTIDPNLVYALLIIGLWLGVTSAYMPGTGAPEIVSLILIGGGLVLLAGMPTNWIALFVMVLGLAGFFIFPFMRPEKAVWAELGLIPQAIGGLFLFEGQLVSPLLILGSILLAWLYHRFILLPMMRLQKQPGVSEKDYDLTGASGRVIKEINPVGTINVGGEMWTARSEDDIAAGVEVTVLEQKGLELIVEKSKRNGS